MAQKLNDTKAFDLNEMLDESIHLQITPSSVAKENFFYAVEAGFNEKSKQITWLENQNSYLLGFVVSGAGRLLYDKNKYLLEDGDLFYIDCSKYHEFFAINEKGWNLLFLYFQGKSANGYYKLITNNKHHIFKMLSTKTTSAIFWQIISLHKKNNRYAEILTSQYITRLLTDIYMTVDDEHILDVEYPGFIQVIFYHLSHYYDEKITIDMLADTYNINKYRLQKQFKRYTGTTIYEYLITTRIDKAKILLRYTNKSIDEISNEVGFYSASHFIKLFRKREHITPLYYRKQWTR